MRSDVGKQVHCAMGIRCDVLVLACHAGDRKLPIADVLDQAKEPAQPPVIQKQLGSVKMREAGVTRRADIWQPIQLVSSICRACVVVSRMRKEKQLDQAIALSVGELETRADT